MVLTNLIGRRVLLSECSISKDLLNQDPRVQKLSTMIITKNSVKCVRCGSIHSKKKVALYKDRYYCPSCIELGRVESHGYFYHVAPTERLKKRKVCFQWNGTLTPQQKKVSKQLVRACHNRQRFLVYAVTGAGKTEMLFDSLYHSLQKGKRVAIASPRVDVILELFPRIQSVFPKEPIALLHGKQTEAYRYTSLVLCTTHQLLRFYHAFDVLVIDEVDSFPFVGNSILQQGAKNACKEKSALIYLTATPTPVLQKEMKTKKLSFGLLPARFHRKALPVPICIWSWQWQQRMLKGKIPKYLEALLKKQFTQKRTTLLFCPNIYMMKLLTKTLQTAFPEQAIECVSAEDTMRIEKVNNMRKKQYQLLLTSTILERGVTFSSIDVIILGANHQTFSVASLVQISGRAGRKMEDPYGKVYYFHDGYSSAMKKAIKQIQSLNRTARQKGLIDP